MKRLHEIHHHDEEEHHLQNHQIIVKVKKVLDLVPQKIQYVVEQIQVQLVVHDL
jgi:hypothetical protein